MIQEYKEYMIDKLKSNLNKLEEGEYEFILEQIEIKEDFYFLHRHLFFQRKINLMDFDSWKHINKK